MSVLIKGMEMPPHCAECEFHGRMDDPLVAQHWCKKTGENILNPYKGRGKDCPPGDVPTPHGRLIDADALTTTCIVVHGSYVGDCSEEYIKQLRDKVKEEMKHDKRIQA